MKIFWATKLRGFLRHLSKHVNNINFVETENYYETNSKLSLFKSKLVRLPILNPFGVFQIIKVREQECDAYGSFNRFLNADKPYFIYLENPVALYHYSLGRISFPIGKKRFKNCLNDKNLKYIVCMSEACRNTFVKINLPLPEHVKIKTIYPLVPSNRNIDCGLVEKKSNGEYLKCLYCVQGSRFISKGGLEVLSAYHILRERGCKVQLTIITKISDLDKDLISSIQNRSDILLYDFSFTFEELEKVYAETNVLLQPSSDDSLGLTVLEAMKAGCAIVASKLYAFPEMIIDGYNGFLLEPKYWFFDKSNFPNPKVWNNRKKTIFCRKESPQLVESLVNAISKMEDDRVLLKTLSLNSLNLANTKFGEETICKGWEDVWQSLVNATKT